MVTWSALLKLTLPIQYSQYSVQFTQWVTPGHAVIKILKRSGVPRDYLLHYYIAVTRPVLEYCSCIWHHNIPQLLSIQIESIQKRALRIILNCDRDTSYEKMLADTGIFFFTAETKYTGKNIFFQSILWPDSCVSRLLRFVNLY